MKIIIAVLLFMMGYLFYAMYVNWPFSKNNTRNKKKRSKPTAEWSKSTTEMDQIKTIKFANLSEGEVNTLRAIFRRSFQDGEEFDIPDETMVIIYYHESKIIGYVTVMNTSDFENYLNQKNISPLLQDMYGIIGPNGLYMNNLCVDPDYRGYGVGKILLEEAIDHAVSTGKSYMHLTVFADKTLPITMYQKTGFSKLYDNVNQSNGKTFWTMTKSI